MLNERVYVSGSSVRNAKVPLASEIDVTFAEGALAVTTTPATGALV